jgi:hypothetical protein
VPRRGFEHLKRGEIGDAFSHRRPRLRETLWKIVGEFYE